MAHPLTGLSEDSSWFWVSGLNETHPRTGNVLWHFSGLGCMHKQLHILYILSMQDFINTHFIISNDYSPAETILDFDFMLLSVTLVHVNDGRDAWIAQHTDYFRIQYYLQ